MKDQNKTKAENIIDYLNRENEYSKFHLDKLSELKAAIFSETVAKIKEDDETPPVNRGEYSYYTRNVKGSQYSIQCRMRKNGKEEVLLDINQLNHEYCSLGAFEVSPDHSIVAYALDLDGSEIYNIYFKDLKSGNIIETIEKVGGDIEWFNDNNSILYTTLDETLRNDKVHKFNLSSKKSELMFHEKDEKFRVGPSKSLDGRFLFISVQSSMTSEWHYIDASLGGQQKVILPRSFGIEYDVEHHCGEFLININSENCVNFKLVSVPVGSNPPKSTLKEVIPYDEKKQLLSVIPLTDEYVGVFQCSSLGYKEIRILEFNGKKVVGQKLVSFDEQVYAISPSGYSEQVYNSGVLRIRYSSMTTPPQVWEYNLQSSLKTCLKSTEFAGFDPSLYQVERIYAPSNDGVSIPISLVYRKDKRVDGKIMPLYLYGYGSYGISIDPNWNPQRFSLLDRGIAFAIAHIRGGGDCSRPWYLSGKFKHKKNTFDDFVACAKFLVAQKWTDHSIMAIEGRSAGGLLIGAVINIFPEISR